MVSLMKPFDYSFRVPLLLVKIEMAYQVKYTSLNWNCLFNKIRRLNFGFANDNMNEELHLLKLYNLLNFWKYNVWSVFEL